MKNLFPSVLLAFCSIMFASGQPVATLSLPDLEALPPGEIYTPIIVEDISEGDDFGSFQFFISYDPSVLTPVEIVYTNPGFPSYEWANSLFYNPDEVLLTWLAFFGGISPSAGEEICQIKWQYTGAPDYTDLFWGSTDDKSDSSSKGITKIWTYAGIPYMLDLINGSVGGLSATLNIPDLGVGIPSGSVFFPITIDQINGGIDSLKFYLNFDPLVLNPEDVIFPNPDYIAGEWMNNLSYGPGEIELTWKNIDPGGQINVYPNPIDTLCILQFFYSGEPDFSALSWGQSEYIKGDNPTGISSLWNYSVTVFNLTLNDGSCGIPYQPVATLGLPHLGASLPGPVIFPVTIEELTTGESVESLEFYFTFDPNVITPLDLLFTDPNFPSNEWVVDLNYGPNEIHLSWVSLAGPKYPGIGDSFCSIEFYYTGYPGYSDLSWGMSKGNGMKGATVMWNGSSLPYFLTLVGGSCGYNDPPEATLSVPDIESSSAGSVFFPVTIENIIQGIDVESLQFYLLFDPDVLTPLNVTYSDPNFPVIEWSNNLTYGLDEIELTWTSSTGPKYPYTSDTICTIEFHYSGYPAYSDITWGLSKGKGMKGLTAMWNSINDPYILTLQNGSISPSEPPAATLSLPVMGENIPAGPVHVPVILDEINGGVYTLQYYISYQPSVCTPIDIIYNHPDFEILEWSNDLNFGFNEIELTWMNQLPNAQENVYPQSGDTICLIEFLYEGHPEYSYFAWDLNDDNTGMWDNLGEPLDLTLTNGYIGPGSSLYASLSLPDLGGAIPAGTISTPLTLDYTVGDGDFGTFQIGIQYDNSILTPMEVIFTNPNLPFYEWSISLDYSPDMIVLTWLAIFGGYLPSTDEELCTISWSYSGDPYYSDLTFSTSADFNTSIWTTMGVQYSMGLNHGSVGPSGPPPLFANFTADPLSGYSPLEVQFTDISWGNITSWEWDFDNDDMIDSYDQHPLFIYEDPGLYSCKLIISDGTETDTLVKPHYITICNPAIDLIPDTIMACFTNNILLDAGPGFDLYNWNTGETNQMIYVNSTGTYSINAADTNGCNTYDSTYINIINESIIQNDTTIQFGDSIMLTIGNGKIGKDYTYLWSTGATSPSITVGPEQSTTYFVEITDGINWCTDSVHIEVAHGHYFDLKVFLEGPFQDDQMIQNLNELGYIPLNQPYEGFPWYYSGDESIDEITNYKIVDWILVELRETSDSVINATEETIIGRKAGLLLNDGSITDLDGSSLLKVNFQIEDQVYIVIWHRNHLGIISSLPAVQNKGYYSYDFTESQKSTYGGTASVRHLGNNIWGLRGGNGLGDGQIDSKDKNDVWINQINTSGYLAGDYDMDGLVSMEDKYYVWRHNAGRAELIPEGTGPGNWVCGESIEDTRDGQKYRTVQIGSQCWMAENLNIGSMIDGMNNQTDNGIIEKYCYDNNSVLCDTLGGLYLWDEMMQYSTLEPAEGICPPIDGWHLPSDSEWKILEGVVDGLFPIGDPEWDLTGFRGYNAGYNIKSTTLWYDDGNGSDLYSFSALPVGTRINSGTFSGSGVLGIFWTSTHKDELSSWMRYLASVSDKIGRTNYSKVNGFLVRCVK